MADSLDRALVDDDFDDVFGVSIVPVRCGNHRLKKTLIGDKITISTWIGSSSSSNRPRSMFSWKQWCRFCRLSQNRSEAEDRKWAFEIKRRLFTEFGTWEALSNDQKGVRICCIFLVPIFRVKKDVELAVGTFVEIPKVHVPNLKASPFHVFWQPDEDWKAIVVVVLE